ncbi:MAG: PD-(D/E)XK nuclease family protein, partial [Atopobiaceae bacterium]|nr:PD-(D/E)XK nuclease family protein [Atopobiaceae bacterium]
PAGTISEASKHAIVVPPPGRIDLLDGKPLLSATQIETYLECPLKWFSLRRLKLENQDAGFSGMEIGTFVHGVLESLHKKMLDDALERAGMSEEDLKAVSWASLPDSRVDVERNPERMDFALALADKIFDERLESQYVRKHERQPLIPHTEADLGTIRRIRHDIETFIGYEAGLFDGFEPRHFEWDFGSRDNAVEYAGAYITGTIDRVDVDGHGLACVIDYKQKSATGFAKEYAVFPNGAPASGAGFVLPRRVQSLIYGQVVRRRHPDLKVVAAVYLSTQDPHAVSGAVSANLADRIFWKHAPAKRTLETMTVSDQESFGTDGRGMDAVLDATEELIRQKIAELMAGNIEAAPCDAEACMYCPVLGCEKRLG